MRLQQEDISVTRSGKFEETQFKIKASAKAFDIMSSKLYSDPHLAIVRELSTNAWDAHVEAGTQDKPFKVHLPNRMEPFFYIRDFGPGMSHEDIMTLYTTYFESTKTQTNDQAGCLGLGSKAPFSYTDQFSVTSWNQGKKRVYSMFKGEEGFPKVALMQTLDSDEHSGLEVRFACKKTDSDLFIEKARRVYRKFPVKPDFNGNSRVTFDDGEVILAGNGWTIYRRPSYRDESFAIMGPIGYPINRWQLNKIASELVSNVSIDVTFPIGALEIAASREELQYSDFTKENLTKALEAICEEIAEVVGEQIEECKSLWEARQVFMKQFCHYDSPLKHLRDSAGTKMEWCGRSCYLSWNKSWDISHLVKSSIRYEITANKNHDLVVRRKKDYTDLRCEEKVQFMINDTDAEPGEKIRSWMKNEGFGADYVYLIELEEWNEEYEEKFHKLIGTNPSLFMLVSNLPKPKRKKATKTISSGTKTVRTSMASKGYVLREHVNSYTSDGDSWESEIIDLKTPGIYVPWKRSQAEEQGKTFRPFQLREIFNNLKTIGLQPDKIYGIKAGYVEKVLKEEPKWKSFFEYAQESLENYIKTNKLEKKIATRRGSRHLRDLDKWKEIASYIKDDNSPIKKFVKYVARIRDDGDKIRAIIDLTNSLDLEFSQEPLDVRAIEKKLYKRYPMVEHIGNYSYRGDRIREYIDAAKYVELVDNCK